MSRRGAGQALIGAIAVALAWFASSSEPGQRLELALEDSAAELFTQTIDSDVVIIAIDAKSLSEVGQWPWPRRLHAELLNRLSPAAPARLFIDIDFSAQSGADDAVLAAAMRNWAGGTIVLPAFLQQWSSADTSIALTEPMPSLREHATVASVNLRPAADGLVRSVATQWTSPGGSLPSVSALLGGLNREQAERTLIDYTIDPSSFLTLSYSDVLANRVPAQYFAGKTVFIGATAIELGDMIPVPVHQALPGVTVQALALESVRQGTREPLPAMAAWLLVAAWTLALAIACRRCTWRRGGAIVLGALASILAGALLAYGQLDRVVPVLPFAVSAIAVYLMTSLRSLEFETLNALAYAVGFRNRDALLKSIVQSSSDCIVCIDSRGVIQTANPASSALFRRSSRDLVGMSLSRFVPDLLRDTTMMPDGSGGIRELMASTEDGDTFPVELAISRVQLDDEQLYTAIIRDISERYAQQQQLKFQATHDALTSLPNRPALAAHLDSLLHGVQEDSRLALLMIDLDRFKEVNDTLGHNIGDYVLHEVARRLDEVRQGRGFIARIGGDEFALVMDNVVDLGDVEQLSRELVDCLRTPIETCGASIDIGLSIGIALSPDNSKDAEELFRHSDVAMYVAKRANAGYEFYDAANDQNSIRRLEIAGKLRRAIANNELQLYYQPQLNLRTGDVDSVEALVRWNDPVLGFVGPDEFIPIAETTDLIGPMSTLTMTQAFEQSVRWRDQGLDLMIAVNVSARLLQDAGFPALVSKLMEQSGVSPSRIELEITESAMMLDPDRALRVTEALSKLGVQISIDDYGTGYSSLAYLRDLPAHALKLDKSFVLNMEREEGDRIIAASTLQMAHALNMEVVAEGVETPAIAALLRDMGYDYAQGYLYSPALKPDALAAWVRDFRAKKDSRAGVG